jgi:DNA-binding LacI/PurR family transcriptional regulator
MLEHLDKLRGATRKPPKHEVIRKFLLEEFMKGNYETGQALPSESTLSNTLGVARSTVRQAIGALENEGLVKRIKGKGSYFAGMAKEEPLQPLEMFSLIVPDISHGLYPILAKGFDHQAGVTQQQVMMCNTDFDINKQGSIILQMLDKKVAGVVLVPAISVPTPAFHVRLLQDHGIPVVFCHRPVADTTAPLIGWDWEGVARMAGEALVEHGHRRIAYFARYRYPSTEAYERGLRDCLQAHGLDLPDTRVHYGDTLNDAPSDRAAKSQALKGLLKGRDPVTAIFCHDDDEAELIHHLAQEMGLKVPDDFSLIGFGDGHERTGIFRSQLASVTVNEYNLGARAATVLHEIRTGARPQDSDEFIHKPLTLVEGRTLGRVRPRLMDLKAE